MVSLNAVLAASPSLMTLSLLIWICMAVILSWEINENGCALPDCNVAVPGGPGQGRG
jgi:hypothetical protein